MSESLAFLDVITLDRHDFSRYRTCNPKAFTNHFRLASSRSPTISWPTACVLPSWPRVSAWRGRQSSRSRNWWFHRKPALTMRRGLLPAARPGSRGHPAHGREGISYPSFGFVFSRDSYRGDPSARRPVTDGVRFGSILLKNSFFTDDGKILGVIRREARSRLGGYMKGLMSRYRTS
jgi:hypothetical protein